jgi:hypothetical protein
MATPAIYAIKPDAKPGALDVSEVWTQANNELPAGFTQLIQAPWKGGVMLLGADAQGKVSLFQLSDQAPYVAALPQTLDLGGPCDILAWFVLGGASYVIAYQAQAGLVQFFGLQGDLTLTKPYVYSRVRLPAVTPGWTVLQPVVYLNKVYFVSYNFDDGAVNLFAVVDTAGAPEGQAPLETDNIWAWTWAKGWTRFAFFTLGGENFFLKTNTAKLNVNIDHLNLDPNVRSSEVLTNAQAALPNAPTLDIVRPFVMAGGAPFFLTYLSAGQTQFFDIHPDCQGWTQQAEITGPTGATQIVTYRIGETSFALFY